MSVSVGTFNIQRAQDPNGRVSLRGLGDAAVALDCDVLGLQEVDRRRRRSRLREVATGPTYPADQPTIRLDYIAVDGAEVTSARVGPRQAVGDHLPVVAELRVPGSLP